MNDIKKQVVLCVDDDRKNLELLEALLLPLGYELKFSGSGEDALKWIQTKVPDLILLDVMMPYMSGFEVLERLRSDKRTQLIPVVLLTALNGKEDKARGLKTGCDDFISKPFDKNELIARVRSLLRISSYRSLLEEKEKMEIALHGVAEGVVVCGPDWVVTNVNETGLGYLGKTNPKGLNFVDLIFSDFLVSISANEVKDLSVPFLRFKIKREGSAEHRHAHYLVTREVLMGQEQKIACFFIRFQDLTRE